MIVRPSVYKVDTNSRLHKNLLLKLIEEKRIPENVFFDVEPFIDFERFKAKNEAYLILRWTYTIPAVVHFIADTTWIISEYESPKKDDTEQINYCIVVGMANYLIAFEEKTGIDMRPIIPDLNKERFAELSAQILLKLRKQG